MKLSDLNTVMFSDVQDAIEEGIEMAYIECYISDFEDGCLLYPMQIGHIVAITPGGLYIDIEGGMLGTWNYAIPVDEVTDEL